MNVDCTVLSSVLAWLALGGGSVFVANYAFAWLAENFEFWHKFPHWLKLLIPIIVSVLLAFGAQQLLEFPDIVGMIQPYWELFIFVILAWLGSQKGYITAKKDAYGAEKRLKG